MWAWLVHLNLCADPPALLLLMVHASANAEGRKRRDAIRNTWLSDVDKLSEKIGQAIMYK